MNPGENPDPNPTTTTTLPPGETVEQPVDPTTGETVDPVDPTTGEIVDPTATTLPGPGEGTGDPDTGEIPPPTPPPPPPPPGDGENIVVAVGAPPVPHADTVTEVAVDHPAPVEPADELDVAGIIVMMIAFLFGMFR